MNDTNTARGFWVLEPGLGGVRTGPLPAPGEDEVQVQTLYSGISKGTESLVFRGEVPASQYGLMRAPFQEGEFPGPLKYGYMNVGRVEVDAAPRGGRDSLVGATVFCLFPHQDRYVVPAAAVVRVPEGVPPERAVLAANLETALNAVWDGGVLPGDRVAVVGAGVVGLLIGWICAGIPGTEVVALDPDGSREGPAQALGMGFRSGGGVTPSESPGEGWADVVFHTSGSADGARSALRLAGTESVVVEVSWYGTRAVPLPLGEGFHSRRLTLKSSQVGSLPPGRAPRWTHGRRMALALDLLHAEVLDVLVTGESPLDELPEVMARLAGGGEGTLLHRIRYH